MASTHPIRTDIMIPAAACAVGFAAYVEATNRSEDGDMVDVRRVAQTFLVSLVLVYGTLWLLTSETDALERLAIKNIHIGEPGF